MNKPEVLFERKVKKSTGSVSGSDGSSGEDAWDDTQLIKAYDKAVKLAKDQVLAKLENGEVQPGKRGGKSRRTRDWNVGDKCKCKYSVDDEMYEADVINVLANDVCVVRYVGYENEEKVPMRKLMPSDGEMARCIQIQMALHNPERNDTDMTSQQGASKTVPLAPPLVRPDIHANHKSKKKSKFHSHYEETSLPQPMVIPPPPPPMALYAPPQVCEGEALNAMLMSWYMSGYHTGYYQGLKDSKK